MDQMTYLSNADIQSLKIAPGEAREAILVSCRNNATGRNINLPASYINIGPGHAFGSMSAASEVDGIATVKWAAVAPVLGNPRAGVNGLICVSDYRTGVPIAILDGNFITLLRTAALSAAAAMYLAPEAPEAIGLVGCGLQAISHLDAFVDLFPSLSRVYLLSRSTQSTERLAAAARKTGLDPTIVNDPDILLGKSQIVISTVPNSQELRPFLNARSLPSSSFASAVDGGRSWRPETLVAFDRFATDSLQLRTSPTDAAGKRVESVKFQEDLLLLATGGRRLATPARALFCFGGMAIADLALADLAIRKARALGIGTTLSR